MSRKTDRKKNKTIENRVVERDHLVFYLRIFDGTTNAILGHLADLSTDGLMLVSVAALELNKTYQLKMLLPKEVAGRLELVFEARILWCRADANPDFYISGFQFLNLDKAAVTQIRQLADDFGLEKSLKTSESRPPACNLTHTNGK